MGGRGASSGVSDKGNPYGSQYRSVLTYGNIKFVIPRVEHAEQLVETMTRGRVYVLLGKNNEPKTIIYFDNENKTNKQIDIDHYHKGLKPHTRHGYERVGKDEDATVTRLTDEERKLLDLVIRVWDNHKNKG